MNKNYAPKLYKSWANLSTKEWEDIRRNSLGGSDMAVILGMSPYNTTKLDIYNQKIGKKPVNGPTISQNVIFSSGHFLENMVADIFSYRTGYETYEIKAMFEHPLHPYLRGNIDRFYRRRGTKEPLGFLECKTSSVFKTSEWADDKIPTHYMIQIATYMSILNMDHCKISCLFIPESLRWVAGILYQMKAVFGELSKNCISDIRDQLSSVNSPEIAPYVPMVLHAIDGEMFIPQNLIEDCSDAIYQNHITRDFERSETLENAILEAAEHFWKDHVEKRIPPSLDGEKGAAALATIGKYTQQISVEKPIALPNGDYLAEVAEEIAELKEKKSTISSRIKNIDSKIEKLSIPFIEALNGADTGYFTTSEGSKTQVSFKSGSVRKSISTANLEKLKNNYPDAYDEYVVEKATKPSLKIGG